MNVPTSKAKTFKWRWWKFRWWNVSISMWLKMLLTDCSAVHVLRRRKNSRTKITRSRRQRNGRNVRFIEREKTRCLWNVPPDASRRGPLLRKWLRAAGERWKKRRMVNGRTKKKKKRGGDHLSFVSYRNAEGNGRSGTKVFLFPEDPFSPLLCSRITPRQFHSMSISVYSALPLGGLETSACENLKHLARFLRIIRSRKMSTVHFP